MQAGMGLKAPFLLAVFSMTHAHLEKVCVLPRSSEAAMRPRGLAPGSRLFSGHQSCDWERGVLPLGLLSPLARSFWAEMVDCDINNDDDNISITMAMNAMFEHLLSNRHWQA